MLEKDFQQTEGLFIITPTPTYGWRSHQSRKDSTWVTGSGVRLSPPDQSLPVMISPDLLSWNAKSKKDGRNCKEN